jgi:hypothetical protein
MKPASAFKSMKPASAFKSTTITILSILLACLAGHEYATGAEVIIDLHLETTPENVAAFQGDTVVFRSGDLGEPNAAQGYPNQWQTPPLRPGEQYARQFVQPGTYVYLTGTYSSNGSFLAQFPGTIQVQPLTISRPAISLVSPPDGFVVPGHALLQAAVTNAESEIAMVQFFDRGKLIGTATNAPYRLDYFHPADPSIQPPAYVFTAQAINKDGSTNISPPIVVRDHPALLFNPMVLPGGAALFFYSLASTPNCAFRTANFTEGSFAGGWKGESTVLDNSRTSDPVRIYFVRFCL